MTHRMAGFQRTLVLFALVAASGVNASAEQATSTRDSTLRIRSVKRTERFDDTFSKLTVRDPVKDVILVLELAGISVNDFNATPASEVFLMAGDRRFEPSIRTGGDWEEPDAFGVKEERRVVVIVPRDATVFSLHFGKRAPLAVKADTAIAPTLP